MRVLNICVLQQSHFKYNVNAKNASRSYTKNLFQIYLHIVYNTVYTVYNIYALSKMCALYADNTDFPSVSVRAKGLYDVLTYMLYVLYIQRYTN